MEEEKDKIYRVIEYKDDREVLLLETKDKIDAVEFILSNYSNNQKESFVELKYNNKIKWNNLLSSIDKLVNMTIPDALVGEKGFVLPFLNEKQVRIIELEKKDLEGLSTKKIIETAKNIGLVCTIPADETKNIGDVYISTESIYEFANPSSFKNSHDFSTHYSIMFGLKEIIRSSELVEIHPDRHKLNKNRDINNGYNNNILILRAYCAVKFKNEDQVFRTKLTLKQMIFENMGKKLYTYEVVNIESIDIQKKIEPLQQAPFSLESPTPPALLMDSISLANILQNIHKECDKDKNILEASKESEKILIEPGNNILKEYLRQNEFLDRETQEKIVKNKGTHITTNVDIRLDSEIETIKDKLESQQEDQEESNTKSVRRRR